jgi:hypothetical protein
MLTEQMTRAQAAGPAPLMRSAPRPSPVLFQCVTTSNAAGVLADALDGLEDGAHVVQVRSTRPGCGQVQRIQDDEGRRVHLQLGLDRGQLAAGAGGGQVRYAKAQPQPVSQPDRVDALGGGDGLDATHGGSLSPSPKNTRTGPGLGQAKWSNQGRPMATETARSRAAQVLPAFSWAASTP